MIFYVLLAYIFLILSLIFVISILIEGGLDLLGFFHVGFFDSFFFSPQYWDGCYFLSNASFDLVVCVCVCVRDLSDFFMPVLMPTKFLHRTAFLYPEILVGFIYIAFFLVRV